MKYLVATPGKLSPPPPGNENRKRHHMDEKPNGRHPGEHWTLNLDVNHTKCHCKRLQVGISNVARPVRQRGN